MWRVASWAARGRWRAGVAVAGAAGASVVAAIGSSRGGARNSEGGAAAEVKASTSLTISPGMAEAFKAAGKAPKESLDKIDSLFALQYQKEFEVYELLRLLEKDYPLDSDVLCRLARISRQRWKDDWLTAAERRKSGIECFDYATRAVAADPSSAEAHKWLAVGYVTRADAEGCEWPLASHAAQVKEELDLANRLKPGDPSTLHLLGHWHFYFADLPSRRRKCVRTKGQPLPAGSFEEAKKLFDEAEAAAPGFSKKNDAFLTLTLSRMNKWPEAYAKAAEVTKRPNFGVDDVEADSLVAPLLPFTKHRSAPHFPPSQAPRRRARDSKAPAG